MIINVQFHIVSVCARFDLTVFAVAKQHSKHSTASLSTKLPQFHTCSVSSDGDEICASDLVDSSRF